MISGITPPLCFNFLKMTGLTKYNSEFMTVMGPIDIVPIIGTQFQQFFPCFLVCLCVINYYDWWSRCMCWLGLDDFAFTPVLEKAKLERGRRLFEAEKRQCKIEMQANTVCDDEESFLLH